MYNEATKGKPIWKEGEPASKESKPIAGKSAKMIKQDAEYEKTKKENGKHEKRRCTGCRKRWAVGISHIKSRSDKAHHADPFNWADHCPKCNRIWGGQEDGNRFELLDYEDLMQVLKELDWAAYRNIREEYEPEHPDLFLPHPKDRAA